MRLKTTALFMFLVLMSGCQKETEGSKASILWGKWDVEETKRIIDNHSGITDTTTYRNFEMGFDLFNNGYFKNPTEQTFIWAIQEAPDILIISTALNSFDTTGQIKLYATTLYTITDFNEEMILLHNEEDGVDTTIDRFWKLIKKE